MTNTQGAEVTLPDALPESRRSVRMKGNLHIHDDDGPDPDDEADFEIQGECFLDPFSGPTSFGFHQCVDDEVVVKGNVSCKSSDLDPRKVTIGLSMQLFEGTTCLNNDLDGQTPAKGQPALTFTLDECVESEGCAVPKTMEVNNIDEGDDSGKITVQFFNEQAP